MPVIEHRSTPRRPYTAKTWVFVILKPVEFIAHDLEDWIVYVNDEPIPYGEVMRRNRERAWAGA